MGFEVKTVKEEYWTVDLETKPSRAPGAANLMVVGVGKCGPETRAALIWVLENLPEAEVYNCKVTFKNETDAVAFKTRFG